MMIKEGDRSAQVALRFTPTRFVMEVLGAAGPRALEELLVASRVGTCRLLTLKNDVVL